MAYGVVIRQERAPSANLSAEQLTATIVQSLESSDSNMKQVGGVQPITAGRNIRRLGGTGNGISHGGSQRHTQRERDWLVAVPRGESDVVFLVFVSPLRDYDQMRPAFEKCCSASGSRLGIRRFQAALFDRRVGGR